MNEMKKTEAETTLEIWVECPHCEDYQQRFDDLIESLDRNELRADECDAIITCEECKEDFIVTKINY